MILFSAILMMIALLAFVVSLVMMLSRSTRPKGKRYAKYSAGAIVLSLVIAGVGGVQQQSKEATDAGFASYTEMKKAKEAGVTDPKVWAAGQQEREVAAKVAGDEAAAAKKAAEETAAADKAAKATRVAELTVVPDSQAMLINVVAQTQAGYSNAETDFQKGALRPARRSAICQAIPNRKAADWIGKITTLSTNGDGKGVVSVEIADNIAVSTWNNSLSDFRDKSLIEPGTKVYNGLAALKEGNTVRFSGSFTKSDVDCIGEQSATMNGSLTDPEFVFRFSDISKVDVD